MLTVYRDLGQIKTGRRLACASCAGRQGTLQRMERYPLVLVYLMTQSTSKSTANGSANHDGSQQRNQTGEGDYTHPVRTWS